MASTRFKLFGATTTAAVLGLWLGSCLEREAPSIAHANQDQTQTAQAVDTSTSAVHFGLPDFTQLAEKALPAVASIYTTKVVKQRYRNPFGFRDEVPDQFRDFFRRFMPPGEQEREFKTQGLGSGFAISADGYIVTNHHVVADADEVKVSFGEDEESLEAKIIGSDPSTDLALLKVDPKASLAFLEFGDSESLKIGEWVLAIGNPFQLSHTVTAGIVSAKGRRGVRPSADLRYSDFIQTDASINPGNSGGPLLNLSGKVIGINSAIFSRSGGSVGIGFAIPAGLANGVINQLKDKGRVDRGWLGVSIQEITPNIAKALGLDGTAGALVAHVFPDTPAEKAGIKPEDVIVAFDGEDVAGHDDLPLLVAKKSPDSKVDVVVIRDGKRKTISLTLGTLPTNPGESAAEPDAPAQPSLMEMLGMEVRDLTADQADELGLDNADGVYVADIDRAGAAAAGGLVTGDVILKVRFQDGDEKVKVKTHNAESLQKAIGQAKDASAETVVLFVWRNEHTLFFSVELPE